MESRVTMVLLPRSLCSTTPCDVRVDLGLGSETQSPKCSRYFALARQDRYAVMEEAAIDFLAHKTPTEPFVRQGQDTRPEGVSSG